MCGRPPKVRVERLRRAHKLEWMPLEAGLGQRLGRRAQPVAVPTAVVVADLPRDLDLAARGPRRRHVAGQLAERRAPHAVLGESRLLVDALLRHAGRPRGAAGKAARVADRRKAGSAPRVVAVNVRNNHGGGYSYRLCPSNEPLTEECFQRHPLEFVTDKQAIVLSNGTRTAHAALHATPLSERLTLLPLTLCVICCCRYSHQHTGHLY